MPDIYEFHPIANHFPLMEGEEFAALVEDMRENGLDEEITLYEDKILDGRNRYRACCAAGVEPRFARLADSINPVGFVMRRNIYRMHYTASQRAMLAADMIPLYEEEARKRVGGRPKKDESKQNPSKREGKRTEKPSANLRSVSENGSAESKEQSPKRKVSQEAGDAAGVSSRQVEAAKKVKEKGIPPLAQLVQDGKAPVDVAAKVADLPKAQQEEFVAQVESGNKARDVLREITEEKPAKPVVLDPVGLAVPDKLLDVFAVREDFEEIEKLRRQLARHLDEVAHKTGGAHLARALKTTQQGEKVTYKSTQLEDLKAILKETIPHSSVCPWCHSKHPGRYERACKSCHGHGWVTHASWRLTPEEERSEVEKLAPAEEEVSA